MTAEMSETRKARLCAEWLQFCTYIGWKKSDLKDLCDAFWKHEGWKTFKGWPR